MKLLFKFVLRRRTQNKGVSIPVQYNRIKVKLTYISKGNLYPCLTYSAIRSSSVYGALLCTLLSPWTNELLKRENNETNRSNTPALARRRIILRCDSAIFLLLLLLLSVLIQIQRPPVLMLLCRCCLLIIVEGYDVLQVSSSCYYVTTLLQWMARIIQNTKYSTKYNRGNVLYYLL